MLNRSKQLIICVFLISMFFLNSQSILANSIFTGFYYDSIRDEYIVKFRTSNVYAIKTSFHGKENWDGTEVTNEIIHEGLRFSGEMYLTCNGKYHMELSDKNGNILGSDYFLTYSIQDQKCDSYAGEIPDSEYCGCIFRTPEWGDFMDKVDGIRAAIPPPPNWQQVAETFDSTIRPRLINDVGNLFGEAPPPPPPPIALGVVEPIKPVDEELVDYAEKLDNKEPVMQGVPGLDDSGYTKEDIENEAPEIEFRDDPTGGFNIGNPLESIPKVDEPPVPGQQAKDWMEIPSQPQQQTPPVPSDGGNVNVPNPPTPNNNVGTPPVPGGNNSPAPTPDNNVPAPPTPEQNTSGPGNYKRHPEHADGSG